MALRVVQCSHQDGKARVSGVYLLARVTLMIYSILGRLNLSSTFNQILTINSKDGDQTPRVAWWRNNLVCCNAASVSPTRAHI